MPPRAQAARRSDILLLAVTKKFPASRHREAYDLGLREFGENYVQEFEAKRTELAVCPRALPPDRASAIQQIQESRRDFSTSFRPSIPPNWRDAWRKPTTVGRHDRSEALRRKLPRPARRRARSPALTEAIRRSAEPEAFGIDDDAALVG